MLTLDGKVLSYDREFQVNGVIYPANWLRKSTLLEKQAIGITETPPPAWYDQRFYTGVEQPKDHTKLQVEYVLKIKEQTNIKLSETDWQVIRSLDETSGKAIVDPAVVTLRTAIRTKSDEKVTAIKATTTTEELAAYVTSTAYSVWIEVEEESSDE